MASRRTLLEFAASLPWFGAFAQASKPKPRDRFAELGVRPFLNAAGTYTNLTASRMSDEVMAAINQAARHFVNLTQLHDAVGARLAKLLDCEAAMVTSGAAGALTVGTAACLTGKNPERIRQLPDLRGMKAKAILQRSHRVGYDHAIRACGVSLVEIETEADFRRIAEAGDVAVAFFLNYAEPLGQLKREAWVALGRELGVPTLIDASADVPPVENLRAYTKQGFDLVAFSGGKGICGPQSSGLLLGRRDLVEAARLNTSPHADTIARGMKVNKEEMVGLLVAVENYLARDHAAEAREWEKRIALIRKAAERVPSVRGEIYTPEIANHTPHLRLTWDPERVKASPLEIRQRLAVGEPSIEITPETNAQQLVLTVWMLAPGEAEIVARRLGEELRRAAS
ncbi:MAG: selenocysteine synthase [Bryobacter sp.]|nr:selenocysteine synthase [Bryobacter sp.]